MFVGDANIIDVSIAYIVFLEIVDEQFVQTWICVKVDQEIFILLYLG